MPERAAYKLPEGNVQIAFSGGRTSAYMLHQIIEANGGLPERVVVSFQNTGREDNRTLDFVAEVGQRWGVPIVWLEYRKVAPRVLFAVVDYASASRQGEPFDAIIRRKQALPNQHQRFCSAELKTLTAKRYLVSIGWTVWTSAIGFRDDERHRSAFKDNRASAWFPLRDAGVSKHDVALFWRSQPFDLDLPVVNGKTIGGNCRKCFLKSEAEVMADMRDHPEDTWGEEWEARMGRTFSKRYALADMREMLARQGDWLLSDEAAKLGVLCQADDGECV
jgi:3'-phosphoadenosine 5'-phosphosulfate sulfotransferase (PAPS reductase)/FAD synthetase